MSNGKSGPELPILAPLDFDPPSNGEFVPLPPTALGRRRWEMWREIVERQHRRLGLTRRAFAESACGLAAWLFVIDQTACDSKGGAVATPSPDAGMPSDASGYDVQPSMMQDLAQAREALSGNNFVFDVQTHVVAPETPWTGAPPDRILDYIKLMFAESDTTVACLSGIPATRNDGLQSPQARAQLQELVERFGGSRLLFHCNTDPELPGEPDYMAMAASRYKNIAAWKSYPQNNPQGLAADAVVGTFIQTARDTGIKIIASHRGLGPGGYVSSNSPLDVVQAAKKAPDLKFLVYHSGFQPGVGREPPLRPRRPRRQPAGGRSLRPRPRGQQAAARLERLRRARHHLAQHPRHARAGRPLPGQAAEVRRPRQRPLRHRLRDERQPPAADRGHAHVHHRPGPAAAARLPRADRRAQGQDPRPQRRPRLRHRSGQGPLRDQGRRDRQAAHGPPRRSPLGPDARPPPLPGAAHPPGAVRVLAAGRRPFIPWANAAAAPPPRPAAAPRRCACHSTGWCASR
jgi:hypothetical protein